MNQIVINKGRDKTGVECIVPINEIALIVKVFCTSRTASRDFHKLLETTILMRINDLK
jgi:hypothetical protein